MLIALTEKLNDRFPGKLLFGSALQLLDLFRKHRQHFEEIADDSIIGNVEDRGFGILINGHDGLGVLHSNQMLNRSGDAHGDVKFRSHSLTGRANLTIDRQPLCIADRSRCREIATENFSQFLCESQVVFTLNSATDGDNDIGFAEVDGLFDFLKRRFRFHTDFTDLNWHRFDRRAASLHRLIAAKSARLKSNKHGRLAIRHYVRVQLAQKNASREYRFSAIDIHAHAVADQSFTETSGKFRREVAH